MTLFGVTLNDDARLTVVSLENALTSIGLEIAAALGLSEWLILLIDRRPPVRSAKDVDKPTTLQRLRRWLQPRAGEFVRQGAPPLAPTHQYEAFPDFVMSTFEQTAGESVKAGDAWVQWKSWCASRGLAAGNQRAFCKAMKAYFTHAPNNGRPKYQNVRLKTTIKALRLVSSLRV